MIHLSGSCGNRGQLMAGSSGEASGFELLGEEGHGGWIMARDRGIACHRT